MKKTILTGVRPTGNLHFGHLFGTMGHWVKLQDEYECFFEIADVQALTDNFNSPDKVRKNVYEVTIDLLSIGIDPNKGNIFIQSEIHEIAELTIFYSNLVTMARLYRNPTVKSEIAQKKELFGSDGEGVTYGFVGYPVSQAADITIFNADLVPVGEDQLPLIEQCREITRKFNSIYGQTITEVEHLLGSYPRIKGLDGKEKMGKSLGNALYLNDDSKTVSKKIMGALTDPNKIKKDDPANPEVCMVYYYHKLIKNPNIETVCKECMAGARGCVACKKELIEKIEEFLEPIREKRAYYEQNPKLVDEVIKNGTKNAKKVASSNMKKIKEAMKIDYFEN